MKNFKTFNLAVEFYHLANHAKLPYHLKEQLQRASSSIALNLAEGRGKATRKDQIRFFHIALGSLRESQGILILGNLINSEAWNVLDKLGASLYCLIKNAK